MYRSFIILLVFLVLVVPTYAQQWSAAVNISNTPQDGTFSVNPAVSIDSNGVTHVTYDDGIDIPKSWEFWYTNNGPGYWLPRVNAGYPLPDCRNSIHGYMPDGHLIVCFQGFPYGYGNGVAETYIVEQVNGVMQYPVMVSPDDSKFSYGGTAYAVDSDGGLHVGWLDGGNTQGKLWPMYRYRSPSGTWNTFSTVMQANNATGRTTLCVTGSGSSRKVHFFYGDRTSGWSTNQVYYCSLSNGAWSAPRIISNSPSFSGDPFVMSDGENAIYLFWNQENPAGSGFINIYYSQSADAGTTWSTPISLTPGVETVAGPKACIDGSGDVHLIYEQRVSGATYDREIMHRKLSGTTWSSPVDVSNMPGKNSVAGDIACRGNMLSVVWHDNGTASGNYDIFFSSAVLPTSPVRKFKALPGNGYVNLSWVNSVDPALAGVVVVYRTDRYPSSPADGTVLVDRTAVKGSVDGYQHTGLSNGTIYYYVVYSYNAGSSRQYSVGSFASSSPQNASCSSVKSLPNGTQVTLTAKVVTAKFADCWYVEDEDRTSAMRIKGVTDKVIGDRVSVTGTIGVYQQNLRTCEREVTQSLVQFHYGGQPLPPLAMAAKSVGGTALNDLTPGVNGGIGLYNMGLFVKVSGKVLTGGSPFYIDDGSGIAYRSGSKGLKILGPYTAKAGDYVVVQGIVQGQVTSYAAVTPERIVQIRSAGDVVKIQ